MIHEWATVGVYDTSSSQASSRVNITEEKYLSLYILVRVFINQVISESDEIFIYIAK